MEIIKETVFMYYYTSTIDLPLLVILLPLSFILFYLITVKYCKVLYLQPLHAYLFYALINILTMFLFQGDDYKLESISLFIELILFTLISTHLRIINIKIPQIKFTPKDLKLLSKLFFILYLCLNIYVYIKYYLSGSITTDDFKVGWTEQEKFVSFIYGGVQSIFLATCIYEIFNSDKLQLFHFKNIHLLLKLVCYSFFSIFVFKIKGFFLTVIHIISLYYVSQSSENIPHEIVNIYPSQSMLRKPLSILYKSILIIFVIFITLNYVFGLSFEGLILFISRILQSAEALFWAMYHQLTVEQLGYHNNFYVDSLKFFTYSVIGKMIGFIPEAQGNILAHMVPQLPKSEFGGPNTSIFFHYIIGNISFIEVSILLFILTFIAVKISLFFNRETNEATPYQLMMAFPLYNISSALSADVSTVLLLLAKEYIVIIIFLYAFGTLRAFR
jgi:hypothetical protein